MDKSSLSDALLLKLLLYSSEDASVKSGCGVEIPRGDLLGALVGVGFFFLGAYLVLPFPLFLSSEATVQSSVFLFLLFCFLYTVLASALFSSLLSSLQMESCGKSLSMTAQQCASRKSSTRTVGT